MANRKETAEALRLRPFIIKDDADDLELVDAVHARLRQLDAIAAMGVSADTEYSELWGLVSDLSAQSAALLDRLADSIRSRLEAAE